MFRKKLINYCSFIKKACYAMQPNYIQYWENISQWKKCWERQSLQINHVATLINVSKLFYVFSFYYHVDVLLINFILVLVKQTNFLIYLSYFFHNSRNCTIYGPLSSSYSSLQFGFLYQVKSFTKLLYSIGRHWSHNSLTKNISLWVSSNEFLWTTIWV